MTKEKFIQLTNRPLVMRLYLFWKLPMAWFAGIGVQYCDEQKSTVRLPYGWRSQNPFRSTYFAAQCAAAELSTGLLALAHLQDRPAVSMLVTKIEAEYFKKASSTLLFTCEDGAALSATIEKAIQSGNAQVFKARSNGCTADGTLAATMQVTWSFKAK